MIAAAIAFTLASSTFQPNTMMPLAAVAKDCGGQNISPELHWSGAPEATKSFALIIHDPDAPRPGGFYHWAVPMIPATAIALGSGTDRYAGYYGPCPPSGKVHHYNITLFALDEVLQTSAPLDAKALLAQIKGHILAQTTLTGLYKR